MNEKQNNMVEVEVTLSSNLAKKYEHKYITCRAVIERCTHLYNEIMLCMQMNHLSFSKRYLTFYYNNKIQG